MLGVPCVLREAYLVVWVWIDIKSSLYWWRTSLGTSLGPRIYEMLISAMFTAGFWFWSIPMFLGALHTHCFHTERPLVFRSHPLRPLRDIIGWSAPGGPAILAAWVPSSQKHQVSLVVFRSDSRRHLMMPVKWQPLPVGFFNPRCNMQRFEGWSRCISFCNMKVNQLVGEHFFHCFCKVSDTQQ